MKNLFLRAKTIFLFLKFTNAFGKLRKKIALRKKKKKKKGKIILINSLKRNFETMKVV